MLRAPQFYVLACLSVILSRCATSSFAPPIAVQSNATTGQLFWDWGGGKQVDGSGREIVRFSPQFGAGEIVASFGDRRLYFVTRSGEAISYPIAIPRDED